MFLKRIAKRKKAVGVEKISYRLCESYRLDNTVSHEMILHLGALEKSPDVEQKRSSIIRIEELDKQSHAGRQSLFIADDNEVEILAQHYFTLTKEKHSASETRYNYVLANLPFVKKISRTFTNEEGEQEKEDLTRLLL